MELNQTEPLRIVFLKKFTLELIKNKQKEIKQKNIIEAEKIKRKFIEPPVAPEEAFKRFVRINHLQKIEKPEVQQEISQGFKKSISDEIKEKRRYPSYRKIIPKYKIHPKKRPIPANFQQMQQPIPVSPRSKILGSLRPEPKPKPAGFSLGKVEILLRDPSIQMIECQGPGMNLLVKRYNKINKSKIILNQNEITEIINAFSREAKIPLFGGVFKAAVGDLIISAVISELVGSRFIINRMNPYSFLER